MNRLVQFFGEAEEPQEPETEASYWVVETTQYWFIVEPQTARRVEQQLDRWWRPRWLTFTDSWGTRRRVPSRTIEQIYESTPAMRAAYRSFCRARKLEDQADRRPWEDNN